MACWISYWIFWYWVQYQSCVSIVCKYYMALIYLMLLSKAKQKKPLNNLFSPPIEIATIMFSILPS